MQQFGYRLSPYVGARLYRMIPLGQAFAAKQPVAVALIAMYCPSRRVERVHT